GRGGGARARPVRARAGRRGEIGLKRRPEEGKLYSTGRLEPAYSSVRVVNERGEQVDRRDAHVDRANPAVLRATLPTLPPGTYKVLWRVLSIDADVTEGGFTFQIE